MSSEDKKKNIEILIRSVVVAQGKGAFSLKDASVLHQVLMSLTGGSSSIAEKDAIGALIQGAVLGQKSGAFSLEDANTVFEAVKWLEDNDPKLEPIKEEEEQKIKEL